MITRRKSIVWKKIPEFAGYQKKGRI